MNRRSWIKATGLYVASSALLRAQFGKRTSPTFEQISELLESWQKTYPRLFQLQIAGRSVQNRPVFVATLTSPDHDSRQKEHFLLTALHAGQEHSGATSVLRITKWLLSDDPEAVRARATHIFRIMPVVNPDSYADPDRMAGLANIIGEDPYTGWSIDGPRNPEKNPEAVAVQQVMDSFQAEVHGDVHGNSLPFPGVYQLESSGKAYSNVTLRPYHSEITRMMDEAALAGGYPSDRAEEDAQRLFGTSALGIDKAKLWAGFQTPAGAAAVVSQPRIYAALYGYNKYHTMPIATEVGWEESALLRYRRLFRVGSEVWPGEQLPGYPVRVITKDIYNMVKAYGDTAEERRRSRVELWNKQGVLTFGMNRPWVTGRMLFVCTTSVEARQKWLRDTSLTGFLEAAKRLGGMPIERIASIIDGFPTTEGQWGHTSNISLAGGMGKTELGPIQHGMNLRLRIPYPLAHSHEVWLNNQPLKAPQLQIWRGRGFNNVQISLPPERTLKEDVFVITMRYDPGEHRVHGLDALR
jgi:hypothetical protein